MTRASWLHLAALWSVAIAQPLFGPLAASPEFFIAHRAGATEILVLTVTLVVLLPLLLIAIVSAVGSLGPRAHTASVMFAMATLTGILAMHAAVQVGLSAWFVAVPLAIAAGAGVAVSYVSLPAVRSFFSMLSIAIVVIPAVFLAAPGIRSLVLEPFRQASILPPISRTSRDTPVVLVVFDELPLVSLLDRHRQIDRALYPNFRALARDGIWFRNATSVNDFTRWAVPSILSGQYPRRGALPTAADHPQNLFTLLGGTHRLEVDETLTTLCPPRLCSENLQDASVGLRLQAIARDLGVIFLHATLTNDLTAGLPKTTETWAEFRDDRSSDRSEATDLAGSQADSPGARDTSRAGAVRSFIAGIERTDLQPTL